MEELEQENRDALEALEEGRKEGRKYISMNFQAMEIRKNNYSLEADIYCSNLKPSGQKGK